MRRMRDEEVAQYREIASQQAALVCEKDAELAAHYKRAALMAGSIAALANQSARLMAERVGRDRAGGGSESPDKRPLVAIVVTAATQVPLVKALCSSRFSGEYRFLVFSYADSIALADFCAANGIATLGRDFELVMGTGVFAPYRRAEDTVVAWSDGHPPGMTPTEAETIARLHDLLTELCSHAEVAKSCRRVMRLFAVRLLVMFEDNAEHWTGTWIGVAREELVPSVIVPFTIADQLEPAEAHYHDPLFWADEGLINRYASWLVPHWTHRHRDRALIRRKGSAVLAAETLGFATPCPWILNSSKADAIAVESARMQEHYIRLSLPSAQLITTGSPMDDVLHRAAAQRDAIRRELGLDLRKRVLLCSFPPNQLTATRPDCEFADFASLMDFWLGALAALENEASWQVIVKPHPALDRPNIERLRSHSLTVTERETATLIPICDLYNTSVSSTIRWALACGRPVLNYDVFRYRYRDFIDEPAVVTVERCNEFTARLSQICNGGELEALTGKAKDSAPHWGMLDGRSDERLGALFKDLIAGSAVR